jgi:anti-sigma B factor antagonist
MQPKPDASADLAIHPDAAGEVDLEGPSWRHERFSFEVLPNRSVVTLRLHGELDLCGAPSLISEAERLCAAGFETLRIDTADVVFIDMAGLRALLHARQCAGSSGRAFGLYYSDGGPLARLLELAELADLFCGQREAPDGAARGPRLVRSPRFAEIGNSNGELS